MIIKENNNLRDEIFAFLDETGGYTDYNQKIEDVSEEFGLSEDEAENFVWSWASNSDSDLVEESYDSDYTYEDRYERIKSKSVCDSDGFYTDYTMYYDNDEYKYIFIFGDNNLYDPYNSEPDWECETEREANEWYNDYNGFEDDLDECIKFTIRESEQKYNSAITSINSGKLPAVFSKVRFEPNTINLDYGGGKFDNVAEYLKDKYNVTNLVYDKYNRSSGHNSDVLKQVKENGGADTVTCSNVLNVIAEPEIRQEVLRDCKKYLKSGGTCYITVYEGNGSGEGKANDKRQSYQTNMKLDDYIPEVKKVFSNVTKSKGMLICK